MIFRLLLFLCANDFFWYGSYFIVLLLLYNIVIDKKFAVIKINSITFICLILASISYGVLLLYNDFYTTLSKSTFFLRVIGPPSLFYIGYSRGFKGYLSLKKDIMIIVFAIFTHGFLNVIINRNVDVLLLQGRYYQDIYRGIVSATLQNLMFIFTSALLFYFLVYEKQKKMKILGIFTGIFGIYGSINNASRTILVLVIFIFFICLFFNLYLKYGLLGVIRAGVIMSVLIFLAIVVVRFNLFGIQEWYTKTPLGRRMQGELVEADLLKNSRWTYAKQILEMILDYPLGKIPSEHYAHNFWIDIAKETGILPFVFYGLFIISSLKNVFIYIRKNYLKKERIIFIGSLIFISVVIFFIEPIMQASPLTFGIYCFLIGGVLSLSKIQKNSKEKFLRG